MHENRLAELNRWLKRFQPEPEATELRELVGKYAQVLQDNMRHVKEIHELRDTISLHQQEVMHMETRLKATKKEEAAVKELNGRLYQELRAEKARFNRHRSLVEAVKDLIHAYRRFEEQEARMRQKPPAVEEHPAA